MDPPSAQKPPSHARGRPRPGYGVSVLGDGGCTGPGTGWSNGPSQSLALGLLSGPAPGYECGSLQTRLCRLPQPSYGSGPVNSEMTLRASRTVPVMSAASSESRNATRSATAAASPNRRIAIVSVRSPRSLPVQDRPCRGRPGRGHGVDADPEPGRLAGQCLDEPGDPGPGEMSCPRRSGRMLRTPTTPPRSGPIVVSS